jgi:hypothetical protein
MRSRAQKVPFGGALHLERRPDTARASATRPNCELPPPTGKLSNLSRIVTVCEAVLAGARLGEIDHRSLRDNSMLDEMPHGDQELPGDRDNPNSAHA